MYSNREEIRGQQEALFTKLKNIMYQNPGAIKNAQMKWILELNKKFKQYNILTPKQFQVLKDISVQVAYKKRVISR